MSRLTLSMNGKALAQDNAWINLTVREFFKTVNWEDKPPEVYELTQDLTQDLSRTAAQGSYQPLSLTLTVRQFFDAFPWDGLSLSGSEVNDLDLFAESLNLGDDDPAPGSIDDMTLGGFSDLFG